MNKDEVLVIALSFKDLLKELQILSKSYRLSLFLEDVLKTQDIPVLNPYADYKDDRWVVILTEENYIIASPYSEYCRDYLKSKE